MISSDSKMTFAGCEVWFSDEFNVPESVKVFITLAMF